jgi:peptidoglycan/LPS O-acetylase OafA/YrhL
MKSKFHFKNLDSIRTIAFLSTFLAHAFYTESSNIETNKIFVFVNKFREMFSFGVPVFFVLSGFLITFLMLKTQEKSTFSLKGFYLKRVLRIWPVYYVVIIFGFFLFPIVRSLVLNQPTVENANFWMYLGFLSNFDQINNGVLPFGVGLGPTWSVSVEEQFYLFWPLILLVFPRSKFIKAICLILVLSLFCSIFFNFKSTHTVFSMIYLSVGSLFGYLSFYNIKNINQRIGGLNKILLLIITIISFLVFWNYNIPRPISIFIFSFGVGIIIINQCYTSTWSLHKIKILENNGKYTYGLYLYHSIAIFIVSVLFKDVLHLEETISVVIVLIPILSLTLSYVISRISFVYFESYFLNLKEKLD